MHVRKFATIALLGLTPLIAAGPAKAATFTYGSTSGNYGDSETITFSGLPNSPADSYEGANQIYANSDSLTGTISGSSSSKTISAWCIDFYDLLQGSGAYTLTKPVFSNGGATSNIPTGAAGVTMSQQMVGEIGALVTYGSQSANKNAVTDAAVQVAIWDVEYNKGSATASPFTPSSAAVTTEVGTLLADINPSNVNHFAYVTNVTVLAASGNQNLVTVSAVPVPASLPLFASALAGLGAFAARRRAKKASKAVDMAV
jgi:hypothetical protein